MPTSGQQIKFLAGLQANYDEISPKDLNTIYFCTDTQRLFQGESEYTRPVGFGTSLPSGYMPPNSLFFRTDENVLYFSQNGSAWNPVSNFYTHPSFTARVLGDQEGSTLQFGGTFKVPKITVDEQGHVSAGEDITFTMPTAQEIPDVPDVETADAGSGNAVTSISADGHTITVTKGETFATADELGTVETTANNAMPKSGGAFTGAITVQAPTENTNPATKEYADSQASEAEQNAKDYADSILAANDAMVFKGTIGTEGTVSTLPDTHETGWTYRVITAGTYAGQQCEIGDLIICIADGSSANNAHWTVAQTNIDGAVTHTDVLTTDNILLGDGNGQVKASGVKVSDLATATDVANKVDKTFELNGHALSGDSLELSKTDIGLGNVDNTADANKNVASAGKLTTPVNITISGDATGTTSFDGSNDATITLDVQRATADADGNDIQETYATKTEVQQATLVWGEF